MLSSSPLAALSGFCSAMIKRLLLAVSLFALGLSAWANAPDYVASVKTAMFNNSNGNYTTYPTAQEACNRAVSSTVTTQLNISGSLGLVASYTCQVLSNGSLGSPMSKTMTFQCPYGGSYSTTSGLCYGVPDGGGPPSADPCADKNPMIRRYNYGASAPKPYASPDHFASCKVVVIEMLTCGVDAGVSYCYWKIARTGAPYTGPANEDTGAGSSNTTPPPTTPPPSVPSPPIAPPPPVTPDICPTCVPCPKGTVQAGVGPDGVPMCVGTGTNPPPAPTPPPTTTKPPTTTTGADGSTVVKQDTVQSNSDGSTTTTTTTTTTAPDGTKTVTVAANTTAAASGSAGRTDTNAQDDKYNLCKQNPTLSICRESSVSGTCGQITCTGDAIQCSTLRAAAIMQCQQAQDIADLKAMPSKALGDSILSGADPQKGAIDAAVKGTEVDLSKPNLDSAGFLGGGSCFPTKTFSVMGHSVTMDMTSACNNIQPLRNVVLACAFIVAYLIVSRSVLAS